MFQFPGRVCLLCLTLQIFLVIKDILDSILRKVVKVKGKDKCIYIALIFVVHTRRSDMDHTVLPAITPMLAFTS